MEDDIRLEEIVRERLRALLSEDRTIADRDWLLRSWLDMTDERDDLRAKVARLTAENIELRKIGGKPLMASVD